MMKVFSLQSLGNIVRFLFAQEQPVTPEGMARFAMDNGIACADMEGVIAFLYAVNAIDFGDESEVIVQEKARESLDAILSGPVCQNPHLN